MDLEAKLQSKDLRIGFSQCTFFMENDEGTSNDFGVFPTGSTKAQLKLKGQLKLLVNIDESNAWDFLFKNSQSYH